MPLTTVVGSSGSGKTTFLNDLNKQAKSVYIRQYHQIRPYVAVTSIPHFDPSKLPYWKIYEEEGTAAKIPAGGTMAGEFTPGLSGGQRKILLFELILQRTLDHDPLLIVLDEPFAGVTDDFVPWIVERLKLLRERHNVVLVTNDHVQVLTDLADNTITVSALDRSAVKINHVPETVDREKAILALISRGGDYVYPKATQSDLQFFFNVEVWNSKALLAIFGFTTFFFGLFLLSFWNSDPSSAAYILIAGDIIAFFSVNPYLLSLVDWRNTITEEAEALMHSSRQISKLLKTLICVMLILFITLVEYGMVNAVTDGLENFKYALAMFFDTGSTTFPYICYGIYTSLPHQMVEMLAIIPFLFLVFFSTTFSPGAGLPGIKELRYLFSRFYFWCMVDGVKEQMEGCPKDPQINMLLLCITGLGTVLVFVAYFGLRSIIRKGRKTQNQKRHKSVLLDDQDFQKLLQELYDKELNGRVQPQSVKEQTTQDIASSSDSENSPSLVTADEKVETKRSAAADMEVDC